MWLQDILRTELGFNGIVISDDLSMQAAHVIPAVSARVDAALQAGCDLVLLCNSFESVSAVLKDYDEGQLSLSVEQLTPRYSHLFSHHARSEVMTMDTLKASEKWQQAVSTSDNAQINS